MLMIQYHLVTVYFLNVLDVKYTMQTKREKYNQYNVNKSKTWTSCIHEQQQIFQKMKDTYLVHICIGYITNRNQDIDTLYNDIVHKEIRIRYYNYHLFKHQLLTDINNEMKESR
ncbi:unnamed protein product [Schistosoma rodhaini]|uniref:Uncharacterized protein n=1 Tax=Schistosoma rodhaini TaxID=6188 RepID=A0AA85GHM8_9TREM|nr:unnamed protein product [Schistosoma rodhaini]